MSSSRTQIPPKQMQKIEAKFKNGVQQIAQLQNKKAVSCFKQNPNNMEGFVNCFRGFHSKNVELGSLVEQRMNWCLFQFGTCINSKIDLRPFLAFLASFDPIFAIFSIWRNLSF